MKLFQPLRPIAVCMAILAGNAQAQFNNLRSLVGYPSDGSVPWGSLTASDSVLYGMTSSGGSADLGTVFKMNVDGSGYSLLHSFVGVANGTQPNGSLTLSGSTLYGMTSSGGSGSAGTVFKMDVNGSGYSALHSFTGGIADGASPQGALTLSGSTLYGMTSYGGSVNSGAVFKISVDGSGFSVLHSFTGGIGDGIWPNGSLTLSGSTLYGMTIGGGSANAGTVFSMGVDGSGFSLLHSFTGGIGDGGSPNDSLTLFGTTLYGMTGGGGSSGAGTVFAMNTDGSGFSLLHSFGSGTGDGDGPNGSLTLTNSILYGMTFRGGSSGDGTVFAMNTDGSGFSLLHSFDSSIGDGRKPYGSLEVSGTTLYGMTPYGGSNDAGTVFSIAMVPEPSAHMLLFVGIGLFGRLGKRRH